MNSFTLTAVGNLARNPELVAKNDSSYTRFCLVGKTMRARTKRAPLATW